ncbi:hypothetical protein PC129_g194 [Phytophthora cactorum]|uniref:Uncharacterized protein n=1 Tax=Phytophthora cactorum TaxID=29920 RepID=A0A329T422_9STRA|nr:hypothetical protein Pcac1_g130 [Phytophthora cactorum]KAG2846233.1 hypothetical protein PC112_g1576 [Phytophthora cactorum]KAG2848394.1 hypothetical protein PC111_g491 [Phytophthora cactorum]KAG2868778.1 hypothetical protein PC113_g838 [Phytophthora cactorum]KAG2934448.1 hypothetical protein PC114_g1039 [Phytophthora cactorum]
MNKLAVLLLLVASILAGIASAKILTISAWPNTSSPLATVVPAVDNSAEVSILNATKSSAKAPSGADDSVDSVDDDSTDSVLQSSVLTDGDDDSDDSSDISEDASSDINISSSSSSMETSGSMNAAFKIGSVINATSTIEPTYVNWVGTALDTSISSACYREAHIAKNCPVGFDSEPKTKTCWAQCPYSYPIECGLECIRQNDDCAMEVAVKVIAVVQTTLSFATMNVFGNFYKLGKGVVRATKCFKSILSLTKSLIKYIRYVKVKNPDTPQEQLLAILYQTDNVVIDIPVAVTYCLGKKVSDDVKLADRVLTTAELILREVMRNPDTIVSSWERFTGFMKNITLGDTVSSLSEDDITSLKSAMESNSTCGYDMKRMLDRTWMTVAEYRKHNPEMPEDDIRVAISKSNLLLKDIPIATNNCMNELLAQTDEETAYRRRDTLRKTFGGIVDDLISSGTSSNGTYLTAKEYTFIIADKAMGLYAIWDMWAVGGIVSEYFQPICGPTELIGEIDDGSVDKSLGMTIVQGAFNHSTGMWIKDGDGTVSITFTSVDTKDVTVNVKSGGDKIAEVPVLAGKTVTWESNVTMLGGKTLYLDRWRPGFLGLPGTGGGSLLLWVPRSTKGSLDLTAVLNVS